MIILAFIVALVVIMLIRRLGIKKRQKKIDDFKETYDENKVQKQMRNLYEIAPRLASNSNNYKISPLTELEPTYTSRRANLDHINIHNYDNFNNNNNTYHDSNITPPSY